MVMMIMMMPVNHVMMTLPLSVFQAMWPGTRRVDAHAGWWARSETTSRATRLARKSKPPPIARPTTTTANIASSFTQSWKMRMIRCQFSSHRLLSTGHQKNTVSPGYQVEIYRVREIKDNKIRIVKQQGFVNQCFSLWAVCQIVVFHSV